jgi:hypothetical protein
LQLLQDLIEENKENLNDSNKSNAVKFEEALITLCLFSIGGQRREFIVNMTLKVNKN